MMGYRIAKMLQAQVGCDGSGHSVKAVARQQRIERMCVVFVFSGGSGW